MDRPSSGRRTEEIAQVECSPLFIWNYAFSYGACAGFWVVKILGCIQWHSWYVVSYKQSRKYNIVLILRFGNARDVTLICIVVPAFDNSSAVDLILFPKPHRTSQELLLRIDQSIEPRVQNKIEPRESSPYKPWE